jgi:hypothetical protein
MFVSVATIKTHLKHIFAKLDASNRAEALERAHALGLQRQAERLRAPGAPALRGGGDRPAEPAIPLFIPH